MRIMSAVLPCMPWTAVGTSNSLLKTFMELSPRGSDPAARYRDWATVGLTLQPRRTLLRVQTSQHAVRPSESKLWRTICDLAAVVLVLEDRRELSDRELTVLPL